ncbi:PIG-L family deacetylase [Erythrobacter sp. Alg231-14]|uniref:PIG-L family deacetylase n=1 Tax=Erythrobacter sp. Alg231-14 TaxID=1922225 RepID=UPI00307C13D8
MMRAQSMMIGRTMMAGLLISSAFTAPVLGANTGAYTDTNGQESPSGGSIEIPLEAQTQGEPSSGRTPPTLPPPSGKPAFVPADRAQLSPPASENSSSEGPPAILVILAHPDDEITMAPALSRIARHGGEVTVVFATSGDAGPGVSDMDPGQELAQLRENEARCAAFALGLPEPLFWQLGDGALSTMARAPDSAAKALAERVARIVDEVEPDTIMTWGPDGGYGHADHRMVSAIVTEIVQKLDLDRPSLLYTAFPDDGQSGPPGFENWTTIHRSLITDRIRYEETDLNATRSAIDCYESQFGGQARAALPDILHQQLWQGTVYFRLAFVTPH